jgi:hypothetical protein
MFGMIGMIGMFGMLGMFDNSHIIATNRQNLCIESFNPKVFVAKMYGF